MTSSYRGVLYSVGAVGVGALAAVWGAGGHPVPTFWLATIASLALVALAVRSSSGFNSLLVVFSVFHGLYGLSGSFAAVYGAPLPDIFTAPYATSAFLFNYSLATVGLAVGVVARRGGLPTIIGEPSLRPPRQLAHYAILMGAVASGMEIVNGVRVGGVPVLLEGKALYQSLIAELPLNLPSNEVAMLATALMALAVGLSRGHPLRSGTVSRKHIFAFSLSMLPLLIVVVLLGQRGFLLGWIVIGVVGATYGTSVKHLTGRLVGLAITVYLAMGIIYASRGSRGAALYAGDWSAVLQSAIARDAILQAVNPAANEFEGTLGNFSEYVNTGGQELGLGKSYLVALLLPVPSSLYPGEKPQQIAFEFRDLVFPSEGERGSIAGTAYSSILEAYYNFRESGVFIVYVLVGMGLVALERRRIRSGSLWFALTYLMLLPSSVTFHRTSFGDALIAPVAVNAIVVLIFWMGCSFVETVAISVRKPG